MQLPVGEQKAGGGSDWYVGLVIVARRFVEYTLTLVPALVVNVVDIAPEIMHVSLSLDHRKWHYNYWPRGIDVMINTT